MVLVTRVLKDAGMSKKDVDHIILMGGSTCIPKIQSMLLEYSTTRNSTRASTLMRQW